jgi:hypothetical protein
VDVQNIRTHLREEPVKGAKIDVSVAVDVSRSADVQLNDPKRLRGEIGFGQDVAPAARHDQGHVKPDGRECSLARAMTVIAPTVIDAQNPHPLRLAE